MLHVFRVIRKTNKEIIIYYYLYVMLQECAQRFPLALFGNDQHNKTDRFVFAAPHDQVKCVAVLTGDSITNAVSANCIFNLSIVF